MISKKELKTLFKIAKKAACEVSKGKMGTKEANSVSRNVNAALRAYHHEHCWIKKPKKDDDC